MYSLELTNSWRILIPSTADSLNSDLRPSPFWLNCWQLTLWHISSSSDWALHWKYSDFEMNSQLNQSQKWELYITTDGQSASLSWSKVPIWGLRSNLYYCQLRVCLYGAPSLTRGRVCRLLLLLVLANAVIFGSEFRGSRDHILLSQIRDFPFRRLLRLAGLRCRYSTPPPYVSPESGLLYDWRFTANQLVLAPSPLRLTARICFSQLITCGHIPFITSSLTRELLVIVVFSLYSLGSELTENTSIA
jgi:hypothetical protein